MNRSRITDNAQPRHEVAEKLRASHRRKRRADLRAASYLAQLADAGHPAVVGCSSVGHFGEIMGFSGREARSLAAAGRAVARRPALEEEILSGRLSIDAAAALLKIIEKPDLMREGDDWLVWAATWPIGRLLEEIRKRQREAKEQEMTVVVHAVLTESGKAKLDRARVLASRKAKRMLCMGETVEACAEDYLERHDFERKEARARRMPDTDAGDNGEGHPGRSVPAEELRKILDREGDRCIVPGCDHRIWLENAHILAHRHGGSREAFNLHRPCRGHHVLYDVGWLRFRGTADEPVFFNRFDYVFGPPPGIGERARSAFRRPPAKGGGPNGSNGRGEKGQGDASPRGAAAGARAPP